VLEKHYNIPECAYEEAQRARKNRRLFSHLKEAFPWTDPVNSVELMRSRLCRSKTIGNVYEENSLLNTSLYRAEQLSKAEADCKEFSWAKENFDAMALTFTDCYDIEFIHL
jgi:hypothetical protein